MRIAECVIGYEQYTVLKVTKLINETVQKTDKYRKAI